MKKYQHDIEGRLRIYGLPLTYNLCEDKGPKQCPKCCHGMEYDSEMNGHHCRMCGTVIYYNLTNSLLRCTMCGKPHVAVGRQRNSLYCAPCRSIKEEEWRQK